MKKLFFATAVILLLGGIAQGQSLEKGNLIGMHLLSFESKPGVTMEQWQKFLINKYIPELEKHYEGFKLYLVKGIRGENENSLGLIWVIKSEKDRDKYFNDDGSYNEQGVVIQEKLIPLTEESEKLGTITYVYNDWVIL